MDVFYMEWAAGGPPHLPEAEARHATRVLRLAPGARIMAVDGAGTAYPAELLPAQGKTVPLALGQALPAWGESPWPVGLAIAPPKARDRWEWLLEKATELGATDIWPLWTARTERTRLKEERAQGVLQAAMKQCRRSRLPHLHPATPLAEWAPPAAYPLRLAGFCEAQAPLWTQAPSLAQQPALFVIGPEGDFTPQEVNRLSEHGVQAVHFGPTRLRTETAALFALAADKAAKQR